MGRGSIAASQRKRFSDLFWSEQFLRPNSGGAICEVDGVSLLATAAPTGRSLLDPRRGIFSAITVRAGSVADDAGSCLVTPSPSREEMRSENRELTPPEPGGSGGDTADEVLGPAAVRIAPIPEVFQSDERELGERQHVSKEQAGTLNRTSERVGPRFPGTCCSREGPGRRLRRRETNNSRRSIPR